MPTFPINFPMYSAPRPSCDINPEPASIPVPIAAASVACLAIFLLPSKKANACFFDTSCVIDEKAKSAVAA